MFLLLLGCRLRAEALGASRDSKDEGGDDVSETSRCCRMTLIFGRLVGVQKRK